MKYLKYSISLIALALSLASCSEKSLQKYLVEKQDDDHFVKMDIAASLLQGNESNLSQEETETLKTIKKVNVVAYPITKGDSINYNLERAEILKILGQEQYKELARMNSEQWKITLKYTGEEDAVDEVIVFGSDDEKGFAVFRVLGNNMEPVKIMTLLKAADKNNLDFSKFSGLGEIFKN